MTTITICDYCENKIEEGKILHLNSELTIDKKGEICQDCVTRIDDKVNPIISDLIKKRIELKRAELKEILKENDNI